jgi:hypothetical protein
LKSPNNPFNADAPQAARVNGTLIGSNLEDRAAALSLKVPRT